ncbi:MAG: dihydroorotase [Deltaproteobacteria bacterium]|nr:dihydroorotase [Deltaproteobacteria bacterium]MCW5807161.1 dihydroorotase [Deltaproteobacteria bacterium]
MDPGDLVLRGGRLLPVDQVGDVRIAGGRIVEIGRGLVGRRMIDVKDLWVTPGLVDLHVHLREPGQEYKEDIETGTRAAAAGGFTTICCMPNTRPVNDQRTVTEMIVRRAREVGLVRVRPIGAITQNLEGKALADIADMKSAGIVAVSDDGRPVMNAGLFRRACEYARTFDLPVVQHAEDLDLAEGGAMNEGVVSTRIGIRGQPACAESAMVARDLEVVEWTGARYHVAHVSTARSVALVREAKRRGLPVTCEVTPHHLALTDEACSHYDTRTKVMPPLRTAADRDALLEALADGTIDCIATDHAPHSPVEKELEFECAAPGMLGLETAVPIVMSFVHAKQLPVVRAIAALTGAPAKAFDLAAGALAVGALADVAVIDPDRTVTFTADALASKSKNSPFLDQPMRGRAVLTLVEGRAVFDLDGRFA